MASSIDIPQALQQLKAALHTPQRSLFALTGTPGSGKSTLAARLLSDLSSEERMEISCLPMDGFHLSKHQLQQLANSKEAFLRRGAPWTFDSKCFVEQVKKIKSNYLQHDVFWPSFDHSIGDPIENDIIITANTKVILIEGLYLLHTEDGWQDSKGLFDNHWFLDTPLETALERLTQRHMKAWEISQEEALKRIKLSDSINAKLVQGYKEQADYLLKP